MAGWSTFRAEVAHFAPHAEWLQKLVDDDKTGPYANDNSVTDINLSAAKGQMFEDLQTALGINPGNTNDTTIDTLADEQASYLGRALAWKQMAIHFERCTTTPESKDSVFWNEYDRKYNNRKKEFANLTVERRGASVRSIRVGL